MKTITIGRYEVLVDDNDFERLEKLNKPLKVCCTNGRPSSVRFVDPTRYLPLSHFIIGAPLPHQHVDHIDRNPLNNQRSNLRIGTRAQNMQNKGLRADNTTGFKGVKISGSGCIYAQLRVNGKAYYRYGFKSYEEAARAYDSMIVQYKSNAPTNKSLGLLQ